ncbi:NADH dehydrogenase [ubiquinone] iron-sulfur protein 6, mitochondrial-like [Babylonia areolata]|uniref:NADH dehydrogenase [ubiquinone] iron-sulfur protein 6, mitochondrial-like n=1 Tax=Babylonia areolata TaxID=304850 RepID=UPI003FD36BD7
MQVKVTKMASLVNHRAIALSSAARLMLRSVSTSAVRTSEGTNVDTPTHTGQVWDKNDYRRIRFVDKDKLVNPQFAVKLVDEDPVVLVNSNHVFSDGGGALGHPKVYINLDKPEIGVCGYSGRKFIQKKYYNPTTHGASITYEKYLAEVRPEKA